MLSAEKVVVEVALPWAARPTRELLRLAWPIAVSTVSWSLMTLVDTLFVGRLGAPVLAGVGLAGTLAFATLCFPLGMVRSVKVLVSQSVGAGRSNDLPAYVGAGVWLAVVLGVLSVGLAWALAAALPSITATAPEAEHARAYLLVRSLGAPLVLASNALREARYGVGEGRVPMVSAVVANGLNIALCALFVGSLGWGAAGAAWATVTAHCAELAVLVLLPWPRMLRIGRASLAHVRALARVGTPLGLQFLLEVGSFAVLASMIAAMSDVQMAAHQIAIQVIHFSFLPAYAVGEAASVLVGQAVGARRDELVRPLARRALWMAGSYMGLCAVAFLLAGGAMVAGFTPDARVRQVAVHLLWIAAVFQIFDGVNIVARCALRGTGDVKAPAWIGIVTAWMLTPPLTWLLGWHLGLGAAGGWLGLCGEVILGAVLLWWRLERGAWGTSAERSRAVLESDTGIVAQTA